ARAPRADRSAAALGAGRSAGPDAGGSPGSVDGRPPWHGAYGTGSHGGRRVVAELREVGQEGQGHRVGRAVAVLGDDEVGEPLLGRVAIVSVDEHDNVAVLLDGAALAQVGELGPLVLTALGIPVEL